MGIFVIFNSRRIPHGKINIHIFQLLFNTHNKIFMHIKETRMGNQNMRSSETRNDEGKSNLIINGEQELDKSTPIPLYFQIKEIIREEIEEGRLSPGDSIPSERKLADEFDVSRPTIRQALKELVNEGMLHREKGKGTYVAEPKINYGFIQKLITFYDDLVKKGYEPRTEILKKEIRKPRKGIANKLEISPDEEVIFLQRLRSIENDPLVTVMNFVPRYLCPDLIEVDLEDKSLYNVMAEKYDVKFHRADITLEPGIAEKYDKELLEVEEGSPIHLMKNVTYTKDGTPMDYFESRFRGDRGKVRVQLVNDEK